MGSWDGMLNGTTPEQKQAEINKRLDTIIEVSVHMREEMGYSIIRRRYIQG